MTSRLSSINRFVVLMLENRSFDNLLGYHANDQLNGLLKQPSSNLNPFTSPSVQVSTTPDAPGAMPYDPGHEFENVHEQLFGTLLADDAPLPRLVGPAPMSGFISSANRSSLAANKPNQGSVVMGGFDPTMLPVFTALANQGAIYNSWFAPLPGPTWPNRFFVHAASSGGLTGSPDDLQVTGGYTFPQGTIYERLVCAGQNWRIYHDGLPQSAGITSLRWSYLDPFTRNFRDMQYFAADVAAQNLPAYTFIEPRYDTGGNFITGNSMHPQNNVAAGEALIKSVYEALFDPARSPYWRDTMLIITFDEHGGFFDHVPPPAAPPTGFDTGNKNPHGFAFDRYGVRVPALVISAYTAAGTVIGSDPADQSTIFDHTSILATVAARFATTPLTRRDTVANTLASALNLDSPRSDLPTILPQPTTPQTT